jgi:hypothetical protein
LIALISDFVALFGIARCWAGKLQLRRLKSSFCRSVRWTAGIVWKKGVLCMSNALGIFLIVLGFITSYMAVATTTVSVVVLGWVLLGAGAGLVVVSFLTGKWSGFLLTLAAGVLSVVELSR